MGVSTDAQLCFGISFEDGFEFPWDGEKWEGDWEFWWMDINDYENPKFNPFTERGEYKEEVEGNDPRIDEYFKHKRQWTKEHPFPIEVVSHCSGDYPMYILAVKGTCVSSSRGEALAVNPMVTRVSKKGEDTLLDFCHKYKIKIQSKQNWLLSSYWC